MLSALQVMIWVFFFFEKDINFNIFNSIHSHHQFLLCVRNCVSCWGCFRKHNTHTSIIAILVGEGAAKLRQVHIYLSTKSTCNTMLSTMKYYGLIGATIKQYDSSFFSGVREAVVNMSFGIGQDLHGSGREEAEETVGVKAGGWERLGGQGCRKPLWCSGTPRQGEAVCRMGRREKQRVSSACGCFRGGQRFSTFSQRMMSRSYREFQWGGGDFPLRFKFEE